MPNCRIAQIITPPCIGAVIIVDYKMGILPYSARETKSQFFGKRRWTLHSLLVYTKDAKNNKLNTSI